MEQSEPIIFEIIKSNGPKWSKSRPFNNSLRVLPMLCNNKWAVIHKPYGNSVAALYALMTIEDLENIRIYSGNTLLKIKNGKVKIGKVTFGSIEYVFDANTGRFATKIGEEYIPEHS